MLVTELLYRTVGLEGRSVTSGATTVGVAGTIGSARCQVAAGSEEQTQHGDQKEGADVFHIVVVGCVLIQQRFIGKIKISLRLSL